MEETEQKIDIIERYSDYSPPFPIKGIISDLLSGIPSHYCRGLKTIVLTNSGGLNRQRRRQKTLSRKRKVSAAKSLGLYHRKWGENPASIEIFVDNIMLRHSKVVLKIPFFRRAAFGNTLFHEIGHHIHVTLSPEHYEREEVAEKWRKRLIREYFNSQKRYWYLRPLKPLIKIAVLALRTLVNFLGKKLVKTNS